MEKILPYLFLLLIINTFSCLDGNSSSNKKGQISLIDTLIPQTIAGKFGIQTEKYLDSHQFGPFFKKYKEFAPYSQAIIKFYRTRNWQMAWFDSSGRVEQVVILYNRIKNMEDNGIPYEMHYNNEYLSALERNEKDSITWQELLFTSQYLHYVEKMTIGLSKKALMENEWYIPQKKLGFETLLAKMLEEENWEGVFFYQYELLRKELITLNKLHQNGGWTIPEKTEKTYKRGDTGRIVSQIRNRLTEEGYYHGSHQTNLFDEDLKNALQEFQERQGLYPDGAAGRKTLGAMRITIISRIEQVMVNMERCRWLPSTKKSTNIIVNIPDYKLQVMKGDSTLFSMAAIVGKEANKTVIFMGNINEIIFNPYWNIPKSITEKEILPLIKKDPGYLEHNNMEWFGGQLRQKPGPNNALGKIKFIFPNPFNIYLHDTPAKHLFQLEKRNFSHGCIRIGEPLKLATFLLSYEKDWNEKRILDELSQKKEKTVRLSDPIPVYIIYLTSFVDSKGRLNFREDLYKRDNYLKEMLLWVK